MNKKESKKLFKRVEKMKRMQEGKSPGIKNKSIQKIVMMSAVLVLILMLILMVFRQNAILISRQNPEYYRAMTYDEVQPGDEQIANTDYVTFDAYFLKDLNNDGIADKVRGTCKELGTSDDLYMELNVHTNGYLKDAKITINSHYYEDEENSGNFYFATEIAKDEQIKENYISNNTREIEFNNLENGTHILLSGKINNSIGMLNNATNIKENYSKTNSIVLTGTHVEMLKDGSIRETQIEKTVYFKIDWYGTLNINWYTDKSQTNYADKILDTENELLNVEFNLGLESNKSWDNLIFKNGHIEGVLPEINGYAPIEVKLTSDSYGSTISYDKSTRKFIIESTDFSYMDYYYNQYIQVNYPIEAYNETIKNIEVPVKGYIEAYNNPNSEFQNPYKSNIVEEILNINLIKETVEIIPDVDINIAGNGVTIMNYNIYYYGISKEKPSKIYNGISEEEVEDYYEVEWKFDSKTGNFPNGIIMKESKDGQISDEFIKTDKSTDSMENITNNVGIYFSGFVNELLGDNGWIKVYNDETNELLVTFTKEEWNKYSNQEEMYKYLKPVKHVRIETSEILAFDDFWTYIYINNVKELDDAYITTNYTKEEFDNLKEIKSYLYSYIKTTNGYKEININDTEEYVYPITALGMNLDDNSYYSDEAIVSTQQERDMKITIGIIENGFFDNIDERYMSKWVDGEYLLKLPKDIIDLKINSITADKENVQITNFEKYEEEGNIYIKIKTKNDEPEYYIITLDCTITPNPGCPTQDEEVELYAFNKNAVGDYEPDEVEDIYDVNDNNNKEEIIGYTTRTISFVASNSLVTGQKAKNYDEKGSIAISPKIAYISKSQRTATLEINVVNNYSGTIGEIDILGKIPTQGNTFIINENDLGSTYNTVMTNEGIQVPDELKDKVTIYYSEQINPTKDLEESSNGWTTTPTDFSNVKSFLIDLGDYVLSQKESHTFTYEVNLPEGLDYNEVSYSNHGVYFTLNTNEGKLYEQTEPAKLGLMIAEPYNIEITKYERKTDTVVPGATYSVQENGEDEIIGITYENGKLTIKNLFAENEYTLKETISPEGYELNTDEIKFETYEENGELKVQINSGTVRKAEMTEDEHGDQVLQIEVEDGKTEDRVTTTVHHYIYDEDNGGYTTNKVKLVDGTEVQDETIKGWIGDSYQTNAVENLDSSYELYESPQNPSGILSKDMGEIIYYYKLKESSITSTVEKTASTSKIVIQSDGAEIPVLTEESGIVTYNIKYSTNITNYKGKAKIVITDKLPAGIDEEAEGVDLAEGVYNEEDNTVTWTKEVDVDTYTNGTYTYNFDKTIKIVYVNQDLTQDLVNTAYGELTTYYADDYGPNPGGEKDKNKSDEVTSLVKQEYKVNKTVTKVWNDNIEQQNKRPENIVLQIKNGTEVVQEYTMNTKTESNHTFTDLPKYDENGDEINYTVDERVIDGVGHEDDLKFYIKSIEGLTITNTFTVPSETVEVTVNKRWVDTLEQQDKRPANIVLQVKDGDVVKQTYTINTKTESGHTFTGLPKYNSNGDEIEYTVDETVVAGEGHEDDLKFYTKSIEGTIITNTFTVPNEKINKTITKIWSDNNNQAQKRPSSIVVTITGNGETKEQEISQINKIDENRWSYTFEDLAKYDENGNEIEYEINEKDINSEFYKKSEVNQEEGTITNTFEVPGEKVQIPVTKIWDDNENAAQKRPANVTLQVKKVNGGEVVAEETVNEQDGWTHTFEVAKYDENGNIVEYTIDEKDISNEFYKKSEVNQEEGTITNTFAVPSETVEITVNKTWVDTIVQQDKRPENIVLQIKNGTKVVQEYKMNTKTESKHTFTGLTKYDASGNEIIYTVDERVVDGAEHEEDLKFYTKNINGTMITNTFKVPNETIDKTVTKVWNDNSNEAQKRPGSVVVTITGDGETKEYTLSGGTTENEWIYTFTGLPKYDENGNEIKYTIDEKDLNNGFYKKSEVNQETGTITNTFEVPGETVSVDVNKVWQDTAKQQDKRPTVVTVVLKNGDAEAGRQELNSSNGWTYTFTNLVKYDSLGNAINYTVDEVTTNKFYTSSIAGNMTSGYTITNTFTVPNETVDVPVTKVWNHGGNKGEKPQEITLQVKNGQEVVSQARVTEADGWKYTFEDLPKYDEDGNEINYTVDEEEELTEYKKSIDGYTITNTYNGAVITASKSATTEKNNGYVVAGEKITYTITVRNAGGLVKEVQVKDKAPEGTTFVENSIKVNNEVQQGKTEVDLQNGISVNVPAKTETGEGETRVSFEVTVNEGVTGEIRNAGTIKESETVEETNEVETPVVKISKTAQVERKTEEQLGANEVTAGDEITYKIKVENTSNTDMTGIEIEDNIPEGTSIKQINNNGVQEGNKIKWQIYVDKNSSIEVSFVVTVDYEGKDTSIKNVATVDGNETNETDNPYKKQEAKIESSIEKTGEEEITTVDEKVYYEINYEATIEEHVGSAKVTIVDKLPYGINVTESELAGGTYDAEERTITWEENITNIDTYKANEAKKITITKVISLKYDYGNINEIGENLRNEVEGKIELKEGEEITKTDTVTGEHTEDIKIPARVIVHHYIYDEETEEYTEEKVVEDEIKNGIVGETYSTTKSNSVPQNYECINETPEKYQGKMTYEDTEVKYYYKLKESGITSTIEKTAVANKVVENIPVLTNERGQVTYNIKYNAEVNDYIGKVKIVVTDNLPATIDETSSELAGGIYNSKDNTITWEEEVNVNTFTNGKYTHNFNKTIKLVYVDQDVTEDLVNEVNGETKLYYPDNYPEKGGEEVKTDEKEVTAIVKQEYKVDKNVEKIWEDNNNSKGKRPSSVMIELTADGEVVEDSQVELNSQNGWEHTYKDLAKYDEIGKEIEYSIIETEKNPGDLEYYEEPEIGGTNDIIVTNRYKLKETALKSDITKETETVITASNQEVPYTIHYEAEIDEYIGEAVVTIVDELPYKIDEGKSKLDGGVYNEELQTITWTKELGHINTDTLGEAYKIDITKNIVLVYKDLDTTVSRVTNKVNATVELYETEEKNTVETQEETQVEIEGTVVVKYVEKETGKELETAEEMTGRVGEDYVTVAKDIENYTLVGDTENTRGEYKEGTIEVIYYYEKTPAKVIIKYEDEEGKDILEKRVVEGYVSQNYETKAEEIEGYELVEVKGQEKGEMTKEDIVIIYVYKKQEAGGVIVHYIEKETGEKLEEDEIIEGYVGDKYKTERKAIENYQKAEPEPINKEGKMTKETIEVIYYYEKIPSGKVTVKYIDKETKEEIKYEDETGEERTYGYEIEGYVGDKYKTEEKEIPYYKRVENLLPINREGILSQNDETVIYYYEKMSFNMEIRKKVKTVTIKGEEKEVSNGSLTKIEIHRKEITTTPVEIRYVITVSNTGEIDGKGEVVEKIPEGFDVSSNNPSGWEINTDGTMKYAVELKAGESKDIEVVLKWKASETNFGEKKNIALIENIENPVGFEEENTEDNKAEATVIVTVATGKEVSILIILLGFIASAGSLILCYEYELYRKERNQPVRMVKLEGKNVVIRKEVQK